ncbi:hypothetical protein DENSPDRAFT_716999 [Dentipellis sp. KUC8613]|nr:hypothetical protein DENSPDRAFT_716999 [Dentipellis sp. KUC8613]
MEHSAHLLATSKSLTALIQLSCHFSVLLSFALASSRSFSTAYAIPKACSLDSAFISQARFGYSNAYDVQSPLSFAPAPISIPIISIGQDISYMAHIEIGNRAKPFSVILDTGSPDTWVYSESSPDIVRIANDISHVDLERPSAVCSKTTS